MVELDNWYEKLEDGRPASQVTSWESIPAAARGTTEGECGLIPKHVHNQLARCNPLFFCLITNLQCLSAYTGFVLAGQNIIIIIIIILNLVSPFIPFIVCFIYGTAYMCHIHIST